MTTTTTTTFDASRCRKRARLAAVRDGVDAAGVRFLDYALADDDEAIRLINASPHMAKSLDPEDIYIHYIEAANSRFIGDRFMHLDSSTLRNIAAVANGPGIAFMNSHRTGGLSAPSELPFGRAFSGRFEEFTDPGNGARHGRTTLGLYMLRGIHPNGAAGPSTDDLHRQIEAGTLADVSMGLMGGTRLCDVCGEDLAGKGPDGKFICPHAPGTHRKMEPAHIEAQTARGITGGKASYTLVDAMPQEVSAVYKGAVPGAGFRKALALSRSGELDLRQLREARQSYAELLESDDRRTFGPAHRATHLGGKMDIPRLFKFWQAAGEPDEIDIASFSAAPQQPSQPASASAAKIDLRETPEFREALAAEVAREARKADDLRLASAADWWFTTELSAAHVVPAEKEALMKRYIRLAQDDRDHPAEFSRLNDFTAGIGNRNKHGLGKEYIGGLPANGIVLSNGPAAPETDKEYAKRVVAEQASKQRLIHNANGTR